MMLSDKEGNIDFLGIHPLFRNWGIAHALLTEAMSGLSAHDEISITTYPKETRRIPDTEAR